MVGKLLQQRVGPCFVLTGQTGSRAAVNVFSSTLVVFHRECGLSDWLGSFWWKLEGHAASPANFTQTELCAPPKSRGAEDEVKSRREEEKEEPITSIDPVSRY